MTGERVFRLGIFEIEDDFGPYPGFTCDEGWNGWACPYFTRATADVIVERLNTLAQRENDFRHDYPGIVSTPAVETVELAWYDAARDCYVFPNHLDKTEGPDEVKGVDILALDSSFCLHVYPIGAFNWIWDEVLPDDKRA